MKVVIVGYGKVGNSLCSALLREGHDVTVIDSDEDAFRRAKNTLDIMCVNGNGAVMETLLEAGVQEAGLLIAATPYDELNVLCCLVGKRLGAKKTISRVRTPEYYSEMHLLREELRLSMVINPESSTADEITRALVFPSATKVEVFQKGKVDLVEYRIGENSVFDNCDLITIYKKVKTKLLICAVQRGEEVFIPDGSFVLRAGDRIHIAATQKNIERFFRADGLDKDKIKTVLIVGGGSVGYYLAKRLAPAMRVKIIENDKERCKKLAELLPECVIINGDGTDVEVLAEEGLSGADAFIALTGIDEENILISMYAKNNSDAKIVTKVSRDNYTEMAKNMGLDTIINPKELTSGNVISYVRSLQNAYGSEIESLYHLVDDRIEAIEFRVTENIPGVVDVPLKDMKTKKNILICAIIRKREIIIPDGNAEIQLGDTVVVVAKEQTISSLNSIVSR